MTEEKKELSDSEKHDAALERRAPHLPQITKRMERAAPAAHGLQGHVSKLGW